MSRAILHIDLDAFYASVEQRDNPNLRGRPLIVGGHPRRGVVLAASYEVRPFGVRSAIPMAQAIKLAPHAIVVPPRPSAYAEASDRVFAIFESVTPLIEPLSLDEAFLDVTNSKALFGSGADIARNLRQRIADEVGLPASAGIAPIKFVAKICSDLAKPNGQKEVHEGEIESFLRPLPVSRLWGVGPKAERELHAMGLKTVGDIAQQNLEWLTHKLGNSAQHFYDLSRGIDPRAVISDHEAKSIGAEDTFEDDLADIEALKPRIHAQALRVGRRLRRSGVKTQVVQLKLKYADFTLTTRRTTLKEPLDDGQEIYREALALLTREPLERAVRLTGVSAQDLGGAQPQLSLFAPEPKKSNQLNAAIDRIAEKFGQSAITTADLAGDADENDDEDEDRRRMSMSRLDRKKPPR